VAGDLPPSLGFFWPGAGILVHWFVRPLVWVRIFGQNLFYFLLLGQNREASSVRFFREKASVFLSRAFFPPWGGGAESLFCELKKTKGRDQKSGTEETSEILSSKTWQNPHAKILKTQGCGLTNVLA
jgi:hypothetical protein